jgi:hypothetical protein
MAELYQASVTGTVTFRKFFWGLGLLIGKGKNHMEVVSNINIYGWAWSLWGTKDLTGTIILTKIM